MSDETTQPPQVYGFFGLLWRLSLAGVIVLGLSATGGYYGIRHLVQTPEAPAPDLLTLELATAIDKASKDGFSVITEKRETTDILKPGHVLAQRPLPETWVKQGSTIRLTISDGAGK